MSPANGRPRRPYFPLEFPVSKTEWDRYELGRGIFPEGGEVRILSRLHEGLALIEVSDDGTGVPQEIQDGLFEPFLSSQGDRGAGLGLLIAREIARQQGGDLRLRSSSRQGTSFAVSLQVHAGASHLS